VIADARAASSNPLCFTIQSVSFTVIVRESHKIGACAISQLMADLLFGFWVTGTRLALIPSGSSETMRKHGGANKCWRRLLVEGFR
jgi:hypothetical protein